jgi:hypothetical protein
MAGDGDPDDSSPSGTTDGAAGAGRGGRLPVPDPRSTSASLARARDARLLRSWMLREVRGGNGPRLGFVSELRARGRGAGGTSAAMPRSAEPPMAGRLERLEHLQRLAGVRTQGLARNEIPISLLQASPLFMQTCGLLLCRR